MVSDGSSNYKRVDDQIWRDQVNDRLSSLTASEVVQNDRLDAIQEHLETLNQLLEGAPADRNDNGLKGDIVELSRGLNALRAILAPDALGHGGYNHRLATVEQKLGIDERGSDNRWKFGTVVASATIGAIATILVALLAIEPVRTAVAKYLEAHYSTRSSHPSPKNDSKRSGSKAAKPRRPPPAVRPTEASNDAATEEDVPEGRSGDGGHAE